MIQQFIWLVGSIIIGLAQNILVFYNAAIIIVEIGATQITKICRYALRWVSVPWPSVWKRKRRMYALLQQMRTATSYDAFLTAARELDELEGSQAWRAERESDEYDYELIEETTKRLRRCRHKNDIQALLFSLRTLMSKGYGGIDRPTLYSRAFCGTKHIIEKYIQETIACLEVIANSSEIPEPMKAEFFETCRLSVGRTALALSGGGALAMGHMGVVKTLIQRGLLPRVISGTSGGSIIAAMMAMHTDEELLRDVLQPGIVNKFTDAKFFEPLSVQIWRFIKTSLMLGQPRMMNSEQFENTVKLYYGEETFESAFRHTGRIVNITVTVHYGGMGFAQPLVLNYLTAPQVLLWSAVAASCALPGLMKPVALMAKAPDGRTVPFHPVGSIKSIDGSMHSDIPAEHLGLMFHCNRTVVSQTNPHVVPFLRDSGPRAHIDTNLLSRLLYAIEFWLTLDIQSRTKYLSTMRLLPKFFGAEFSNVFLQRYSGDVTIAPHQPFLSQWKALSQPSETDMAAFILEGQRATWPHICHIRTLVALEKKLSACARRFTHAPRGEMPLYYLPMSEVAALPRSDVALALQSHPPAATAKQWQSEGDYGVNAAGTEDGGVRAAANSPGMESTDTSTEDTTEAPLVVPRGASPTLYWRNPSKHAVSFGNISHLGGTSVVGSASVFSSGKKMMELASIRDDEEESSTPLFPHLQDHGVDQQQPVSFGSRSPRIITFANTSIPTPAATIANPVASDDVPQSTTTATAAPPGQFPRSPSNTAAVSSSMPALDSTPTTFHIGGMDNTPSPTGPQWPTALNHRFLQQRIGLLQQVTPMTPPLRPAADADAAMPGIPFYLSAASQNETVPLRRRIVQNNSHKVLHHSAIARPQQDAAVVADVADAAVS